VSGHIAIFAFGVLLHHVSTCSRSQLADLKPSVVIGTFVPGQHGKMRVPSPA
jgi:hypothetical protein